MSKEGDNGSSFDGLKLSVADRVKALEGKIESRNMDKLPSSYDGKKWPTVDTSKGSAGTSESKDTGFVPIIRKQEVIETPVKAVGKAVAVEGQAIAKAQEDLLDSDKVTQSGLTPEQVKQFQTQLDELEKEREKLRDAIDGHGDKASQEQLNALLELAKQFFGDGDKKQGRLGTVLNKMKIDTPEGAIKTSLVLVQESFGVLKDLVKFALAVNRSNNKADAAQTKDMEGLDKINDKILGILDKLAEPRQEVQKQREKHPEQKQPEPPAQSREEPPAPVVNKAVTYQGPLASVLKQLEEESGKRPVKGEGEEKKAIDVARQNNDGFPPSHMIDETKRAAEGAKEGGVTSKENGENVDTSNLTAPVTQKGNSAASSLCSGDISKS